MAGECRILLGYPPLYQIVKIPRDRSALDSLPRPPNLHPATWRLANYAGVRESGGGEEVAPLAKAKYGETMRTIIAILSFTTMLGSHALAQSQVAAEPIVGLRDNRPDDYALVNASITTEPGKSISNATILIQDTTIIAVGNNVAIPSGFMTMDLQGRTVYPGLIDAYSEIDVPADHAKTDAVYWNSLITPQCESRIVAAKSAGPIDKLRAQGITIRVVAPKDGIVKGSSAVVLLSDESRGRTLLKPNAWQHAKLTVPKERHGESYPTSPMGSSGAATPIDLRCPLVRQGMGGVSCDPNIAAARNQHRARCTVQINWRRNVRLRRAK